MADDNLERITILLQARDRDLSRSLDRMNQRIARFTRDGERNTARMQQQVESHFSRMGQSVMGFGRNLVSGLAVGATTAAIGFLTTGLRQTVRSMAEVGDEARRAGVSVEQFQEWMYIAGQSRIPIDALTDSFKELNLRADEFIVTGAGGGAEAFQRLGFSAEDLRRRLEDPSELMLEIFRRMENLDRAAQIRIFDEILGGQGGERFVELLRHGEQGLRDMMQAARETGAVMSEDMIARFDDIDRRFTSIINTIARLGREAIVGWSIIAEGLADALTTSPTEQTEADFAALRRETIDLQQAVEGLAATAEDLGDETWADALGRVSDALTITMEAFDAGSISAEEYQGYLRSLADAADTAIEHIEGIDDIRLGSIGRVIDAVRERLAALATQARETAAGVASAVGMTTGTPLFDQTGPIMLQDTLSRGSTPPRPAPNEGDPAYGGTGGGAGGGGGPDGYRGAVEDIQARTRALELEAAALVAAAGSNQEYGAAIEYARVRAELMNEATAEGRALTPELQAEIDELAMSYVTAGQSAEQAADSLRQVQEDARRGADSVTSIFEAMMQGGDAARAAIARLLQQLASSAFQRALAALSGGGGGGILSFIGSALGGAKAGGGGVQAGVPYLVNENTPNSEVFIPSRSGGVLNVAQAKEAMRGSGASGGSLSIGFDASMGTFVATMRDETGRIVRRAVQEARPGMVRDAVAATYQASKEFPIR